MRPDTNGSVFNIYWRSAAAVACRADPPFWKDRHEQTTLKKMYQTPPVAGTSIATDCYADTTWNQHHYDEMEQMEVIPCLLKRPTNMKIDDDSSIDAT